MQVTVIDADAVSAELAAAERLADRAMAAGSGDTRTIADLIMDQIEFADTLILNKCDLVSQVWSQALVQNLLFFLRFELRELVGLRILCRLLQGREFC